MLERERGRHGSMIDRSSSAHVEVLGILLAGDKQRDGSGQTRENNGQSGECMSVQVKHQRCELLLRVPRGIVRRALLILIVRVSSVRSTVRSTIAVILWEKKEGDRVGTTVSNYVHDCLLEDRRMLGLDATSCKWASD